MEISMVGIEEREEVRPTSRQPQVPPEMEELIKLLTELFAKASELGLACIEIGEEHTKTFPDLKDLKEACLEVTRIVRRIVKISKRLPR